MSNIDTKDGDVVPSKATITIADTTNVVPPEQDSCSPLPEGQWLNALRNLVKLFILL